MQTRELARITPLSSGDNNEASPFSVMMVVAGINAHFSLMAGFRQPH
jgi:hypothetical protein